MGRIAELLERWKKVNEDNNDWGKGIIFGNFMDKDSAYHYAKDYEKTWSKRFGDLAEVKMTPVKEKSLEQNTWGIKVVLKHNILGGGDAFDQRAREYSKIRNELRVAMQELFMDFSRKFESFAGHVRGFTYVMNVDGIDIAGAGNMPDALKEQRKLSDWKKNAKSVHVDTKGKNAVKAIKDYVKAHGIKQYAASWASDMQHDSTELFYR